MLGTLQTEADLQRWLQQELMRPGAIPLGQLPGGVITEHTIHGTKIEVETVTGDLLVDGTIVAAKLDVEKLSSISANLGEVTAGSLSAVTITGGTISGGTIKGTTLEGNTVKGNTIEGGEIVGASFKTAKSGARVEVDSLGIRGINAAAATKFSFDTTTGILTATAVISAEEGSSIPTKVLAGQIKETQIEEGAINTPQLHANAVTAAKISVGELSAISANLGEITAGTVTGATFRTSSSNPKVVMDAEGFRAISSGGTNTINIPASGATAEFTGKLIAKGVQLEEQTAEEPESTKSVEWKEAATRRAAIWAAKSGSTHTLQAKAEAAGWFSVLALTAGTEGTTAVKAVASPFAERVIINSTEQSAFLQLATLAKRKINFGSVSLTVEGTEFTNGKEVTHGLGATPATVQVSSTLTSGSAYAVINVSAVGGTTFTVQGYIPQKTGVKGQTLTVYWLAIA